MVEFEIFYMFGAGLDGVLEVSVLKTCSDQSSREKKRRHWGVPLCRGSGAILRHEMLGINHEQFLLDL